MKFCHARIVDLCPTLDGVRVEVAELPQAGSEALVQVYRLAGTPVVQGRMFIMNSNLEQVPDITDDMLALDNPYGPVIDIEHWSSEEVTLTAVRYTYAANFNIRNRKTRHTLADRTFWGKDVEPLWQKLQDSMAMGHEPLDFLFEIKEA